MMDRVPEESTYDQVKRSIVVLRRDAYMLVWKTAGDPPDVDGEREEVEAVIGVKIKLAEAIQVQAKLTASQERETKLKVMLLKVEDDRGAVLGDGFLGDDLSEEVKAVLKGEDNEKL